MRGYFDGDGSICISNNQAHFTVIGTPDFLNGYEKYLLEGINKKTPNKRRHTKRYHEQTEWIVYGGNKQCKKIYDYLYKDASVFLERKYQKFISILPSQDKTDK